MVLFERLSACGIMKPPYAPTAPISPRAYSAAFYGFVAFYVVALAVTWCCYLRKGTEMGDSHI